MAKGKEPDLNIQKTADVAQLFYWKTSAWVLSEKKVQNCHWSGTLSKRTNMYFKMY